MCLRVARWTVNNKVHGAASKQTNYLGIDALGDKPTPDTLLGLQLEIAELPLRPIQEEAIIGS